MMSLPEYVDDEEVKNMFAHADKDGNGYISYKEFTLMCKVPDQEVIPTEMPTNTTSNGLSSIRYHSYITHALLRVKDGKKCPKGSRIVQKCPKVFNSVRKCPNNVQKSPNNVQNFVQNCPDRSVQKGSENVQIMCLRNI